MDDAVLPTPFAKCVQKMGQPSVVAAPKKVGQPARFCSSSLSRMGRKPPSLTAGRQRPFRASPPYVRTNTLVQNVPRGTLLQSSAVVNRLDFRCECVRLTFPPLLRFSNYATKPGGAMLACRRASVKTKGPCRDDSTPGFAGSCGAGSSRVRD
jgi:hypothetical protein